MIEPRVIIQRNKLNRVKRTPRPSFPALLVLHAPHARKRPPFEFSLVLCLSRACLGKYSALGTRRKRCFLTCRWCCCCVRSPPALAGCAAASQGAHSDRLDQRAAALWSGHPCPRLAHPRQQGRGESAPRRHSKLFVQYELLRVSFVMSVPSLSWQILSISSQGKWVLRHLYIKTIIVPRQARDKHREKALKRTGVFKCRHRFDTGTPNDHRDPHRVVVDIVLATRQSVLP